MPEDPRQPFYKGFWKKSIPYIDVDFAIDDHDEPHVKRKRDILKKYPQISNLYGPSSKTKYIVFFIMIIHFMSLYLVTQVKSTLLFITMAYFIGGSLASLSGILVHECCHQLVSKTSFGNTVFGYMANIPIIIPMSSSFQKYHMEHHFYQGVRNKDPDLPLEIEIRMIQGSTFAKIIYVLIYPTFYIGRSFFIKKRITISEIVNIILHAILIYFTYQIFGTRGILYWIASSWLGFSIHPAAAHLIQEHFTFEDGQETYSYYGPYNKIFMNIGYHNEHHDFMGIAWDKLPEVNKIANEYYTCFMDQKSWFGVLYNFITKKVYGPQSRVVREFEVHKKGRKKIKND